MPTALSYGVFMSQLVRFAKVNSSFTGFKRDVSELTEKLVCQGFNLAALRKKFVKFDFRKFGLDIFNIASLFNV